MLAILFQIYTVTYGIKDVREKWKSRITKILTVNK